MSTADPNSPSPRLETPRLRLRPVRSFDADAFFAFLGDPDAMRYTHCHASVRDCRRRLAAFEWQRRRQGYAPWAITGKAGGQLLGWGGVYRDPFDPGWGPELGYAFHPAACGQGYATELANACLAWADQVLNLPDVWAFVHPDNAASRRVLEKVGFVLARPVPEMERNLYHRSAFSVQAHRTPPTRDRPASAWPARAFGHPRGV